MQATASSNLHADEEVKVLSSSIICGDPRYFSGSSQFLTSYQKNFGLYSRKDALYTDNCENFRSGTTLSDPTPFQVLAFNFANKINTSRGFDNGASCGGGKSPIRRAFESIDVNGNRRIDRKELHTTVQIMGFGKFDRDVVEQLFVFLSGSNADYIDYTSFVSAIESIPSHIRAAW